MLQGWIQVFIRHLQMHKTGMVVCLHGQAHAMIFCWTNNPFADPMTKSKLSLRKADSRVQPSGTLKKFYGIIFVAILFEGYVWVVLRTHSCQCFGNYMWCWGWNQGWSHIGNAPTLVLSDHFWRSYCIEKVKISEFSWIFHPTSNIKIFISEI